MLGPALHAAFWGLIRTAPADRDLPAIRASAVKTGEALSIVDAQLADRPWVCGDRFTLADIALGIHSYRFLNLPWPLADATPVVLPNLLRWYARLGERPAYRRVVMIPIV